MNGVLEGIERVIVEREDGEIIAKITEDAIDCDPEYEVRMKPTITKHRLFISCPMEGRAEEDIQKSFEKMQKIAEAYTGEKLKIVNPYIPKKTCENADRIKCLADSINLMGGADYFITTTNFWQYRGCAVEKEVAERYGLKSMFVDPKFVTPDALNHDVQQECEC